METCNRAESWEVADIFRLHWQDYLKTHPVPWKTQKMVWDIVHCRTQIMGGHIRKCSACSFKRNEYNSCRNRCCPKCGALKKARWLQARNNELLSVGYFHNVFTLPHQLNPLVLSNPKHLLNLLFKAVKETLLEFGVDPSRKLSGELGFVSILHTWDQQLNAHYHLHVIIPAGAFAFDQSRWIHTRKRRCKKTGKRKDFLFPVQALSKTFKGKYLDFLNQAFNRDELSFPRHFRYLTKKREWDEFLSSLRQKKWVVYSKEPFKGPKYVFAYLGRYVHRVAISNDRIKHVDSQTVRFTVKNRDKGYRIEEVKLKATLFIDRFLLHELPSGFMKIRYFGFLSNRYKTDKLSRIRSCLKMAEKKPSPKLSMPDLMLALTGMDIRLCPKCRKGRLTLFADIKGKKTRAVEMTYFKPISEGFS